MRSLRLAAAAAALTLVLAACGSSSSSASSNSTPSAPAGGGSTPAVSGTPVDVTLKDFSITVAAGTTFKAGTYTFVVTNQGPSSHDLTINGPGVSNQGTPIFGPGKKNLTVTLSNGTYDLYCSVPGHKALGMDTKITVGSGGASAGGGTSSSAGGGSSSGGGWS
ncbi:MAG: plastocyanin/azurin family copper-binding protein [Gaiellales bacterium]